MRFPLMLALKPSKTVMASVVVAHVAAALALFFALQARDAIAVGGLRLPVSLVTLGCSAVLAYSTWRALRLEWSKRALQVVLSEDGSFRCEALLGDRCGRLDGPATDFGWAMCLRVRPHESASSANGPSHRRLRRAVTLMLVSANLARPADWRCLRIWLRHKAFGAPGD